MQVSCGVHVALLVVVVSIVVLRFVLEGVWRVLRGFIGGWFKVSFEVFRGCIGGHFRIGWRLL